MSAAAGRSGAALATYRFVSRFVLSCGPSVVFAAVLEPEPWLGALDHVRRLERLDAGDERAVGRRYATVVGASPYRLRWVMEAVAVEPDRRIQWVADGDLSGRGTWELVATAPGTLVTSTWQVHTTPWWMRVLAPVARPLFVRNHDRVMLAGARRLATYLRADLVSFSTGQEPARAPGDGRGERAP